MKRSHLLMTCLALTIVTVAGLTGPALGGQPLPFKGRMEGRHVSRIPLAPPLFFDRFELTGQATQLGQFELVIETTVDFGTRPPTGEGSFMFIAANGDTLISDVTGSSELVVPGLVLITEHAIINPARSTGRFAGATGTFTAERLADAATGVTGVTTGSFEGTVSLATPVNP